MLCTRSIARVEPHTTAQPRSNCAVPPLELSAAALEPPHWTLEGAQPPHWTLEGATK